MSRIEEKLTKYLNEASKKLVSAKDISKLMDMVDKSWQKDQFVRYAGMETLKFAGAQAEESKDSGKADVWVFLGYKDEDGEVEDSEFEGELDKKQFEYMKKTLKSLGIKASLDDEDKNRNF